MDDVNRLIKEIEFTNKLIEDTKKKQVSSIEQLSLINRKIEQQLLLIESYKKEIEAVEAEILKVEAEKVNLENELNREKKLYEEVIIEAYLGHDQYQFAMYLLASSSINQVYSRMRYLDQYREFRHKRVLLINALTRLKENKIVELEQLKQQKVEQVNLLLAERHKLYRAREQRESMISSLQSEEKGLRQKVKDKQKEQEKLRREIQRIIEEEAKLARQKELSEKDKLLQGDFVKNKGRLPWPVNNGVVTGKHGEHWHPVVKGVKTINDGIDITVAEGSPVYAVFKGTVSKVFNIKGSTYTVIIKHGRYYTVYHNLEVVTVKQGDEVDTRQSIGVVFTNKTLGTTLLHFQVWKEQENLNPEEWLRN